MIIDYMNQDEYILYCQNMIRCYFIDRYLHSAEYDKMRTQARVNYLVTRLHLAQRFAKKYLNALYGGIAR